MTVSVDEENVEALRARIAALEEEVAELRQNARRGRGRYVRRRSETTLLGLPLFDVAQGRDPETGRVGRACGIFAVGDFAFGVVAVGGLSFGVVSIGGVSVGLLAAVGGVAAGGLALGGLAVGAVALGGLAIGLVPFGGKAIDFGAWSDQARAAFQRIFG